MKKAKLISIIFLFACVIIRASGEKKEQPNLLFVFTDQQSSTMLGVAGNKQIKTPVLDQLAKDGIHFTNMISSTPICTPYRGMLMSGQHPLYNGSWANGIPTLPDNGGTFAQTLNKAGYQTAYVGKWHLGGDWETPVPMGERRLGFDGLFVTNNVSADFTPEACFYFNDDGEKIFFKEKYNDNPWELEGQTRQAEEWLQAYNGDKPFAMFVSWHPPHNYRNLTGSGGYSVEPLDPTLIDPYKNMDIEIRPDLLDGTPEEIKKHKEIYRNYMAMVTACDHSVGRLIDILKERGEIENTLIVFTSDHGDMLNSFGAKKPKQYPHDYSCHVPLIMKWEKGLKNHHTSDLLVGSMDIMPTILGLLGLDVPKAVQGQNLSNAILTGDDDAAASVPMFLFTGSGWRGVYTKDWTYSAAKNPDKSIHQNVETNVLFNHKNDPGQMNNLYNNKDYADIQKELAKMSKQWMNRFDDKWYADDELLEIMDLKEWNKNFTYRPIDLLQKK